MDETYTSPENLRRLQVTWPSKLAAHLGCTEFCNQSMGCGSNERIVRKTLEFFIDKINQGIDVSDYIAVIQWTEVSRFEFFDSISKSWGIVKHDVVAIENDRPVDEHESKELRTSFKYNNTKSWASKLFASIVCLGNFFNQHNIKHVFTMLNCEHSLIGFDQYQITYCNDNFVWYNGDINKSGIDNMNVDRLGSSHPSELGHIQIADHIHKFLSTQN